MIVIVPNKLRDAINEALDHAIAKCPAAAPAREALYMELLAHFDEHGVVPDITLRKRATK